MSDSPPAPTSASGYPPPECLIAHFCYHRVATVWFTHIFRGMARAFGWQFQGAEQSALRPGTHLFLQRQSRVDFDQLPPYAATHIVRDPRDIAVSRYFYHRWCDEPWCRKPRDRLGGKSVQDHLNAVPKNEGLAFEIKSCHSTIERMLAWDYTNPRVLELRFEGLIADPRSGFRFIFQHYGLPPRTLDRAMAVVEDWSFERLSGGRQRGTEDRQQHNRKGVAGDWKEHFTPAHRALFKERYPGALQALGYESGDDW